MEPLLERLSVLVIGAELFGGFFGGLFIMAWVESRWLRYRMRGLAHVPAPGERKVLRREIHIMVGLPVLALVCLSIFVHKSPFLWGSCFAYLCSTVCAGDD